MYIELDINDLPPITTLQDAEDFTSLKVVIRGLGDHCFISPQTLERLAGEISKDASWQDRFADMLAFAKSSGWTNASGDIEVHIET